MEPWDLLVSFDVTSPFMKVRVTNSIAIIHQLFIQDNQSPDIAKLVEKCIRSTCFTFQKKNYQLSEAAMESLPSPGGS